MEHPLVLQINNTEMMVCHSCSRFRAFHACFLLCVLYNNNNNMAFLSQASSGRLEMKPKRNKGHGSGTLIASLQALLSKATSLEIFHSLRSLLTDSSQVIDPL